MSPVFGYWTLKGLGQVPRFMLEHVGAPYQDDRWETSESEAPNGWKAYKEKNTHGLAFPNLPYYVDGDVKLTQSMAIVRYLARKHGLAGESESETQQLEMLEGQALDMRIWWGVTVYSPDQEAFNKAKETFWPGATNCVKQLNAYLGQKQWFLGQRITYVDFLFYDLLTNYNQLDSTLLEGFDNLKALLKRFEALPAIAAYMKTDKFVKWPINGPSAFYGGK